MCVCVSTHTHKRVYIYIYTYTHVYHMKINYKQLVLLEFKTQGVKKGWKITQNNIDKEFIFLN